MPLSARQESELLFATAMNIVPCDLFVPQAGMVGAGVAPSVSLIVRYAAEILLVWRCFRIPIVPDFVPFERAEID